MKRAALLLITLIACSGIPDAQAEGFLSDLLSKVKPAKHVELKKQQSSTEAEAGEADQQPEKPEVFVQLGHSDSVNSVAFSPDGKFALSGSDDKTLKLWDVSTGQEIRTLTQDSGTVFSRVTSVAFSPDGRFVLSGHGDITLQLWDIASGREIRTFKGLSAPVRAVAFSPDGKYALSGEEWPTASGAKGELTLWNIATGRVVRTFRGHSGPVNSVAFSPDGRYALSGSDDHTLKLWGVATGREIRTFKGHEGPVNTVAFSPDGKYVLSGGKDDVVKLWQVTTGREVRAFEGHSSWVKSVAFSPDGKHVLSGSDDKTMKLWDIVTGRNIQTFEGHSEVVSVAFSPNGKYALSGDEEHALKLWDVATGREIRSFEGYAWPVSAVALSQDGRYVLSASKDNTLNLWDISTGSEVRSFDGHSDLVKSVAISPDGRYALSGSDDDTLKLWDVSTGREVRTFKGHSKAVRSVAFSPDGRYALSGSLDGTMKLWDIVTGREIHTFEGHSAAVDSVAFSPDGKYALSGSLDKTLKLWDVATGREVRTFVQHSTISFSFVSSVSFSPDGKYALSGSDDGRLKLWDIATGQEVRTFIGQRSSISSVTFSPDGKYALAGGSIGKTELWDIATGKEIRAFIGHSDAVRSVAFRPDGKDVVSGSDDTTTRIWDVATGKEVVKMIAFKNGEWLSITPDGFFAASSPKAAEQLNVRQGMKVYGINQFYDVFYRPDIVKAALAGKDTSSMVTLSIAEAIKNPPPLVEKLEAPATSKAAKVKVAYTIRSEGGGIGEVRVFHNGKLVKSDGFIRAAPKEMFAQKASDLTGSALQGEMRSIAIKAKDDASFKRVTETKPKPDLYQDSVEIEPIPGDNEVSIIAFNGQNSVQSLTKTITFQSDLPPVKPRLHILAIGIDRYRDKSVDLKYAVKDSHDLASRLKAEAASIYGAKNIFVTTIADGQATRKGIMSAIDRLAAEVKPTDHFVLFVASHGVLLGDQYYMVTNDYNGTLDATKLISSNEIVDLSKRIRALSQLYIIDTCHAGGMDGVVSGLYDARMSVLAKKMGLHVFASANSVEEALDGYKGNGLFTHTLLDALNNNPKADKNSDKQVSLIELGSYSKAETKQIAAGLGHAQEPLIINFGQDDPVYRIH